MEKTYFGGHETFVLRTTWLSKGCALLNTARDIGVDFADLNTFDALGIGKNMSKSLAFWLRCTGLCEQIQNRNHLRLSEIGKVVVQEDPYFQSETTVWIMHTYLMAGLFKPEVFKWGFNHRQRGKFTNTDIFDRFKYFIEIQSQRKKIPADRTLRDDVSCFLRTYAFRLSKDVDQDPEDISNSPLQRLKLLAFYPSSKSYEYFSGAKKPPLSIIGLFLALQYQNEEKEEVELRIEEFLHKEGSPGVVLGFKHPFFEQLQEQAQSRICSLRTTKLSDGLGILLSEHSPLQWVQQSYQL